MDFASFLRYAMVSWLLAPMQPRSPHVLGGMEVLFILYCFTLWIPLGGMDPTPWTPVSQTPAYRLFLLKLCPINVNSCSSKPCLMDLCPTGPC